MISESSFPMTPTQHIYSPSHVYARLTLVLIVARTPMGPIATSLRPVPAATQERYPQYEYGCSLLM
jgi:hypothetical protein